MKINGLMIDCARLLELHHYYTRLVDFMADWKMNLLVLHFSDDHGCSIALPGFKELARPHALEPAEIRKLIDYAGKRGIEVVPELETFGHTRYITDRPKYGHLYAGKKSRQIRFNAIDPLNSESHKLMQKLIKTVARLFPSEYFHIGCDEVNLADFCRERNLDPAQVYTDYVNRMMALARDAGKTPMFWADHAVKDPQVAAALDKKSVAIFWDYRATVSDDGLKALKKAGFKQTICAPSVASYGYRFLPTAYALSNVDRMTAHARKHKSLGVLTTVWCPHRYLQGAIYYGIAYAARRVSAGARFSRATFDTAFAKEVFGTKLTKPLKQFLMGYPKLQITAALAEKLYNRDPELSPEQQAEVDATNEVWQEMRHMLQDYTPAKNVEIWEAMKLAAYAAGICSQWFELAGQDTVGARDRTMFNILLREVRKSASSMWDATRYADDPQKGRPHFPNEASQDALLLLRRIPMLK